MGMIVLSDIEKAKIARAEEFFAKITGDNFKHGVVDSYDQLLALVKLVP